MGSVFELRLLRFEGDFDIGIQLPGKTVSQLEVDFGVVQNALQQMGFGVGESVGLLLLSSGFLSLLLLLDLLLDREPNFDGLFETWVGFVGS